jgi:hypothetical protein
MYARPGSGLLVIGSRNGCLGIEDLLDAAERPIHKHLDVQWDLLDVKLAR